MEEGNDLPLNSEKTPDDPQLKRSFIHKGVNFLIPIGAIIVILIVAASYYLLNATLNNYEIDSWNVYTNKNFGFTLKHPNLSQKVSFCGEMRFSYTDIQLLKLTSISADTSNPCDSFNYFLEFHVNRKDETIDQEIQAIKDSFGYKENDVVVTEQTLGNNKVKKMSLLTDIPRPSGVQAGDLRYVKNSDYYFFYDPISKSVYTVYAHFGDAKYEGEIEKIISTLVFDSSLTNIDSKSPFYQYFPKEAYSRQDFTKRNYDKSVKSMYKPKEYYTPLDKLSDDNLVSFKCSYDIFADSVAGESHYFNEIDVDETGKSKLIELPIGMQFYRALTKDPRVGSVDFQYCLTSDNKEYMLATFDGGPLELVELNGDKAEIKIKDSNITGYYTGCGDILAITKDNNFYIACSGGDGTITTWISKVDATTGSIKKVMTCTTPHPEAKLPTACKST